MDRKIRHKRVTAKISGTLKRPRLVVFRSNTRISAQLIDDEKGHVLGLASDIKTKGKEVGTAIAQKAKEKKVAHVVFDRGGYKYHGNVKARRIEILICRNNINKISKEIPEVQESGKKKSLTLNSLIWPE